VYNGRMILHVKRAKNIAEKVIGLIGKEKAIPLLINTHFGIHTFGLKFPIDVVILNNKNKVISLKKRLKPGKIFLWNPIYNNVLELPEGTIDEKQIKINMPIDISDL
jgi:uncharacterized protein